MENTGPYEGKKAAGEVADEAHEDGEVWDTDGEHYGDHDDPDPEGQAPDLEVAVEAPDGRKDGLRLAAEHLRLEEVAGGVEREGVGQQGLDDQDHVDDKLEVSVDVVYDDLLGVLLPGQKPQVAEQRLEHGRHDVAPVQHAVELGLVDHVLLEGRQEDLARVAEHDNPEGDREGEYIHPQCDLGEGPLVGPEDAVAEDENVDQSVHYTVGEAQLGHMVEVLQKGAREQQKAAHHHVGARVDLSIWKCANQQVAAQYDVKNASHQQFNQLCGIDDFPAKTLTEHLLGNLVVAVAYLHGLPELVGFVQTVDQDLTGVAAYVRYTDHGEDSPVPTVVHRVRQRHNKHSLNR